MTTSARGRSAEPAAPAAAMYERKLRPRRTRPLVGRQVGPHARRADPVDPLFLVEPVAVAVEDDAGRDVGRAGEHRDAVPEARPLPCQRVDAGRRGVVLGGEVVGQEEDVHAGTLPVMSRGGQSSQKTWS